MSLKLKLISDSRLQTTDVNIRSTMTPVMKQVEIGTGEMCPSCSRFRRCLTVSFMLKLNSVGLTMLKILQAVSRQAVCLQSF